MYKLDSSFQLALSSGTHLRVLQSTQREFGIVIRIDKIKIRTITILLIGLRNIRPTIFIYSRILCCFTSTYFNYLKYGKFLPKKPE